MDSPLILTALTWYFSGMAAALWNYVKNTDEFSREEVLPAIIPLLFISSLGFFIVFHNVMDWLEKRRRK